MTEGSRRVFVSGNSVFICLLQSTGHSLCPVDFSRRIFFRVSSKRVVQMVAVLCFGQPKTAGTSPPLHVREGKGGVTERTGQGLIRLTLSVIPPLKICLSPLWRCGDITTRSAFSSSATVTIWSAMGPRTILLVTQESLFRASRCRSRK